MKQHISLLLTARKSPLKVSANWTAWIMQALILGVMVKVVQFFFPHAIPYSFWQLWNTTGTPTEWLAASWPILCWAVGITVLIASLTRNSRYENEHAESFLANGIWLSLRAGTMEEIIFRWLLFMWCIATAQFADFIFGGFIFDHGLVWCIYHYLLNPIADYFTMGLLHNELSGDTAWYIAAGLMAANVYFRDGHKYQGLLGLINSWFIGMYMFYLLFNYGLLACILVHLVYDLCIFAIQYVDRALERARNVSNGKQGSEDEDE